MDALVAIDPVVLRFRDALVELYGAALDRVVLFGSRARGEAGPGSDYDVAVFLKHMDNRLAEAYRLADLSVQVFDETGAFIDAKPFRVEEYAKRSPLMHEIRRDGLAL
jgi:predicted nucleotidyltransferase